METEFFEYEFAIALLFEKRDNQKDARDILAHYRGDRNALDVEFCDDDEDQVERNVDHACYREIYKRTLGVAFCTEYGRAEIVKDVRGRADEIYEQIIRRLVQNGGVGLHPYEEISRAEYADKSHDRSRNERKQNGSMHGVVRAIFVTRAYRLAHHDVGAYGQADDDVDDEVDERNVGRYRRERLRARLGKLTDDDQIRRIEQQLQYARKRQRKRHCNEFFEQRSACHVHVFGDGLVM